MFTHYIYPCMIYEVITMFLSPNLLQLQTLKTSPGNYLQALKSIPRTLRMLWVIIIWWYWYVLNVWLKWCYTVSLLLLAIFLGWSIYVVPNFIFITQFLSSSGIIEFHESLFFGYYTCLYFNCSCLKNKKCFLWYLTFLLLPLLILCWDVYLFCSPPYHLWTLIGSRHPCQLISQSVLFWWKKTLASRLLYMWNRVDKCMYF